MSALILILILLLSLSADASQASDAQISEYHRLHQEMDRLAARQAWTGVERAYQAMLDTGVAPTAQDANHAAGAALARGDLHRARERLLLVAQLTENRDVIETLYRIDTEYARVQLSGRAELIAEQRPFQPEAMQAVDFAAAALQDVGGFTGFLPPGRYRYGSEVIELVAGLDTAFNASDDVSKRSSRKKR